MGAAILISELAGAIGALFTTPAIGSWYSTLTKPVLNPPNWLFAPVWTTLFLLMGIAAFLIWRKAAEPNLKRGALKLFGIQLILNVLWTALFFGAHSPFYALLEIVILWFAILFTILAFRKISKSAAYLLLPYIIWVSFAAYLNYSIWVLNL